MKYLTVNVYEGNDTNVEKNRKLYSFPIIEDLNEIKNLQQIDYKLSVNVDENSKLKIVLTIDSLRKQKEIKPDGKVTFGIVDKKKKKIRLNKNKDLEPINSKIQAKKMKRKNYIIVVVNNTPN